MRKIDSKALFKKFTSSEKYLSRASEMYDEYFKQPASRKLIEQIYHELQRYAGTNVPDYDGYQSYIFTTYLSKFADKATVAPKFEYANPNRQLSEIIDSSVSEYKKFLYVLDMMPMIYAHLRNKVMQCAEPRQTADYLLDLNSLQLLQSALSRDLGLVLAVFMEDTDSENLTYLDDDLDDLGTLALLDRFVKAIKRKERSVCYKILGKARDFDPGEGDYLEAVVHFYDQEYEEAIRFALKVKDGDPDYSSAVLLLLECYARQGDIHKLADCVMTNKAMKYPSLLIPYLYQETFLNSAGTSDWFDINQTDIVNFLEYGGHSVASDTMEDTYYIKLVKNTVECIVKIYTVFRSALCYKADGSTEPAADSKYRLALQMIKHPAFSPIEGLAGKIEECGTAVSEAWLDDFRQMAMNAIGAITGASSKITINNLEFHSLDLFLLGLESAYDLDLLTLFTDSVNGNLDALIRFYKSQTDERIANIILRAYTEESISGSLNEKIRNFVAEDLKDRVDNRSLEQKIAAGRLSKKAKFAIESAEYLYQLSTRIDWGWRDAGMISLAYFRIIEVEINQKLVLPILNSPGFDRIITLEKQSPAKRWENIICKLKKVSKGDVSGLMLGEQEVFFRTIGSGIAAGDPLAQSIGNSISRLLSDGTDTGSFLSFLEKDVLSGKLRNKYRNPPAHTSYLPYKTACECREFFYRTMQRLQESIKSS